MEAITSIDRLLYNLNMGPGYEGYSSLIEAVNLSDEETEKVCLWKEEGYSRVRLYDTTSVEALISCWRPGSKTPIHDYKLQQGWIKVLKGTLELEFFNLSNGRAELYGNRVIRKGQYVYLNDGMGFHRFINNSKSDAIALHLYCDKITKWHVLNEDSGKVEEVEVGCDLNLDKRD